MSFKKIASVALCCLTMAATLVIGSTSPTDAAVGDAPVTGAIHIDFDRDGLLDAGETVSDTDPLFPPSGVTVNAYDASGTSVTCVVTAGAPPTYSCPVTQLTGSQFRVEFELDAADNAAGWAGAPSGADYGTSVQFVGPGDVANWATIPPSVCPRTGTGADGNANHVDGKVWSTCFVNGDIANTDGPQDVLVGLNFDPNGADTTGTFVEHLATKQDFGSIHGLAYDEWTGVLYSSAIIKRHTDLGPEGIDGVYWIEYEDGLVPSETVYSIGLADDIGGPSYGPEFAADRLDGVAFDEPSADAEAFTRAGDSGIGDIDVTPDGRQLLVVNMELGQLDVYDLTSVQADPTTGAPVYSGSFPIPEPGDGCQIVNNVSDPAHNYGAQPFAVTSIDPQTALVGTTCADAPNEADGVGAAVISIDLTGATTPVVVTEIPATYFSTVRGEIWTAAPADGVAGTADTDADFRPWIDEWSDLSNSYRDAFFYPQALLSDISVTSDGSMVLQMFDRLGYQLGDSNLDPDGNGFFDHIAGGDTLYICPGGDVEGSAACPRSGSEWFAEDGYSTAHQEVSLGGNWVPNGLDLVVTSQYDPDQGQRANSAGLSWHSTDDGGVRERAVNLYTRTRISGGLFGKTAGIGDVEGCFIPIEIGSFVWLDLDGDGLQDPGEDPLVGVTVTLYDAAGNVIATTVTDANGEYFFDSADGVEANTAYTISFDVSTNTTPLPGGFTNADLSDTIPDSTVTSANDANDSDVVNGDIAAMTGAPGANDHTFDAGFTLPKVFDLALQKQLADGTNLAGVSPGDSVTFTITVTNQGNTNAENITVTDYLPASGLTLADAAWTDLGDGTAVTVYPGPLAPGSSTELDIMFTVNADASGQINNWAEISSADPTDGHGTVFTDSLGAPIADVDSIPDADPTGDNQPTGPNATGDDAIDEDGLNGGDEDDHDVAGIWIVPTFDLALQKQLADGTNLGSVMPSDTVTFTITVFNQGTAYAENMTVTDYLPASGLTLADPAWTDNGDGTAEIVVVGPLAPGASTTVDITFTVDADASGQINNLAEISEATPTDGAGTVATDADGNPLTDLDSTPDTDPTGDSQPAAPNDTTDDEIDEDGLNGGDEDDHDLAGVTIDIFDLALRKQLADGSNLNVVDPGDEITFTLTVLNQGTVDAADVTVVDYLPEGLSLTDSDWTDNGDGTATTEIPGPIPAGTSTTVDITFTVNADASGTIDNWGEIAEATAVGADGIALTTTNGDPFIDIDSIADAINTDNFSDDDSVDGSGLASGDEDDHDIAQITISSAVNDPVANDPVANDPVANDPTSSDTKTASSLALTGTESTLLAMFGLLLVASGAILVAVRRRTTGVSR